MKNINFLFENEYMKFENISFDTEENRLKHEIDESTMTFTVAETTMTSIVNGQELEPYGRNDLAISNVAFTEETGFTLNDNITKRKASWILVNRCKVNSIIENFLMTTEQTISSEITHTYQPFQDADIYSNEAFLTDKLLSFNELKLLENDQKIQTKMFDLKLEEFLIFCLQSHIRKNLLFNYHVPNQPIDVLVYWIKNNLDKNFSLCELSKHTQISIASIHRHFKHVIGVSPNHFIWNLKLIKAKQQLSMHPHSSIQDVSKSIGIENVSYFSKVFKKYTGVSPVQFKNKQIS